MKIYHHNGNPPKAVQAALQAHQLNESILKAVRGKLTLGDIKDDPRTRRFAVSSVDQSRMARVNYSTPHQGMKFPNLQGTSIDPTNIQAMLARGSTPSTLNGTITWSTTTTSITFTWTSLVIYRADGGSTSIPNGSKTFSGLTPSTAYKFYPYYAELDGSVNWAGGANTSLSITASQTMNLQTNVPLSAGAIAVSTPASGTGGGSGGGGANGCLHPSQKVLTKDGEKEASDLVKGDLLLTARGWTPILDIAHEDCREWRRVTFRGGRQAWVTPSQPFYTEPGKAVRADMLDAGDHVVAQYGKLGVVVNSRFFEDAFKVVVSIAGPHLFYLWEDGPEVHNGTAKP